MTRFESGFQSFDGTELFFQTWEPETIAGHLILVHGFAEHSECYDLFANGVADANLKIWAYDMRGHGRSPGQRGFVREFSHYMRDLIAFVQFVKNKRDDDKPAFITGHSMGGLIVLRYLIDHAQPGDWRAATLSSPCLALMRKTAAWEDYGARVLNRFLPRVTIGHGLRHEDLSRDLQIVESYNKDFLRLDKIAPPTYFGMVENMEYVLSCGTGLKIPLLFQVAGTDLIVDHHITMEFARKMNNPKKEIIEYPESYHEIFNDINRGEVYQDYIRFIESHLA